MFFHFFLPCFLLSFLLSFFPLLLSFLHLSFLPSCFHFFSLYFSSSVSLSHLKLFISLRFVTFDLCSLSGTLAPGEHSFSFQFVLPGESQPHLSVPTALSEQQRRHRNKNKAAADKLTTRRENA